MKRDIPARLMLGLFPLLVLAYLGCKTQATRPYQEPPPPGLKPTIIEYADSDAFDSLLESALVGQNPVILIQTNHQKPDWEGRLDAWIAAWNNGGKVNAPDGKREFRMQAPLSPVTVDGESIKEFRLLIDDLMGKVEVLASKSSAWWTQEKVRSYRIALLKPYNLRFHLDDKQNIEIILFNGNYSQYYRGFMQSIGTPETQNKEEWSRAVTCSRCKHAEQQRSNRASSETGEATEQ